MNIDELDSEIAKLSYQDRARLFVKSYGIGSLISPDFNDKLALVSLIAFSVNQLKKKDPSMTTLKFLEKITGATPKENYSFYRFLENLSIMVDELSYCSTVFSPNGFKSSKEIIDKIKELLNNWIPF